jgi:AAA15 family ATPase/GTPase
MFLEFSVSNYRSIGDKQTLSLIPVMKQKEQPQNIIHQDKYSALNAIAIYGANAGGKSNMLKAMSLMDKIIHLSARTNSTVKLPHDPFLLREGWDSKPTEFELLFVVGEKRYRYGFSYTSDEIWQEWLFRKISGREVVLFQRERDVIEVSVGYSKATKLIDVAIGATRTNALFLSTCDVLNIEEAKRVMQWLQGFNMVDGLNTDKRMDTFELWSRFQEQIKQYMASLRWGVEDLDVRKNVEQVKPDVQKTTFSVSAKHRVYATDGTTTQTELSWNFYDKESAGTIQAFHLSGVLLWTLTHGGVLIIDEIEAKLHPIMTLTIIDLFLRRESNPGGAQLIFATHDTNLLRYARLRRDQIYFAEKNQWESTEFYSLADFAYRGEKEGAVISEKERPDTDKERRYIEGRYGAIPALGAFQQFIRTIQWQEKEN